MPAWSYGIADQRDHFKDTALMVQASADSVLFFKILYAVKSPRYLALGSLEKVDDPVTIQEVTPESIGQLPADRFKWHCNFAAVSSAADLPEVEESQIKVIQFLQHRGGMT
eukprot:7452081-Lingulodinium_polyedra.AAC.1